MFSRLLNIYFKNSRGQVRFVWQCAERLYDIDSPSYIFAPLIPFNCIFE